MLTDYEATSKLAKTEYAKIATRNKCVKAYDLKWGAQPGKFGL